MFLSIRKVGKSVTFDREQSLVKFTLSCLSSLVLCLVHYLGISFSSQLERD